MCRNIKTTVKIRNILFATFSHTYQLHLYIVDAPTYTFFVAWYQLSNTLVTEACHLCFQPILYAGLQLIVPKCCPPTTISYEERDENHRESSPGRWWWVIKHFPSRMLQEPLHCGRGQSIPEVNIPRHLFWLKELNYSMHFTFGRRLYCFWHVYRLTTRSELTSAMCCDRRAY